MSAQGTEQDKGDRTKQARRSLATSVRRSIELMQEYTRTLNEAGRSLHALRERLREEAEKGAGSNRGHYQTLTADWEGKAQTVHLLTGPAKTLAQFVSQRVEHAKMPDLIRIELRLRLAEFEGALFSAVRARNRGH